MPNDMSALSALLEIEFQSMYLAWGQKPPRTGIHASAVLSPEWCVREHVLADLYPNDMQPAQLQSWDWRTQAVFLNGWHLHERWQFLFKKFGGSIKAIEVETAHYDEARNLYFTPDAIIEWAGHQYIVEIKGFNAAKFASLRKPPQNAVEQANFYMHLLQLERAVILVENKDTQEFKLWVIVYNRDMALPFAHRLYDVKRALVRHAHHAVTPARLLCATPTDPRARRCPMCAVCFREDDTAGATVVEKESMEDDW